MPDRSVTPRGFDVYDKFTDTYGSTIKVQQSSSAEGPRCWIFSEHPSLDRWLGMEELARLRDFDLGELAAKLTPAPHLDIGQATRLRDALDVFIREYQEGDGA